MKIIHEKAPVVSIMNDVVHKIRDLQALGVLAYILSLDQEIIYEKEICDHFNASLERVTEIFKYLDSLGLLKYNPDKNGF